MKIAFHGISLILLIAIQSTLMSKSVMFFAIPSLMLVYIIAIAMLSNISEAWLVGFFFGLVSDIFAGKLIGIYTLLFIICAILVSIIKTKVLTHINVFVAVIMAFVGTLFVESFYTIFVYFTAGNFSLINGFVYSLLPECIYNSFLMIFIYIILNKITRFMYSDKG